MTSMNEASQQHTITKVDVAHRCCDRGPSSDGARHAFVAAYRPLLSDKAHSLKSSLQ